MLGTLCVVVFLSRLDAMPLVLRSRTQMEVGDRIIPETKGGVIPTFLCSQSFTVDL